MTPAAIALGAGAVAAALSFTAARSSVRARRALLGAWGTLALGVFPWLTAIELAHGWWTLAEGLPLHLCDVSALLVGAVCLRASRTPTLEPALERPAEICFYLCTGGGLAGLAVPQVDATHPTFAPFVAWHTALVVAPLLLVAHGMSPTFAGIGRSLGVLFGLAVFVAIVDVAIDANYMFLRRAPAGTGAILFAPPFHVITLLAIGAIVMLITWLPFRRRPSRTP